MIIIFIHFKNNNYINIIELKRREKEKKKSINFPYIPLYNIYLNIRNKDIKMSIQRNSPICCNQKLIDNNKADN